MGRQLSSPTPSLHSLTRSARALRCQPCNVRSVHALPLHLLPHKCCKFTRRHLTLSECTCQPCCHGPAFHTADLIVEDEQNGDLKVVSGPTLYMLGPYEVEGQIKDKTVLGSNEAMIVVNNVTGEQRVIKGPTTFMPGKPCLLNALTTALISSCQRLIAGLLPA